MRAMGTPKKTCCPNCGHARKSSSIKGETHCSECGKYFVFDKERQREYRRNWAKNNPERYKANYQRSNAKFKPLYEELRKKFNNECDLCGNGHKRLEFHEKDGKSHPLNPIYIRNHIERFVLLCKPCHEATHWAMFTINWEYNQFKEFASRLL